MLAKIFGSKNKRELKRMGRIVNEINKIGEGLTELSDEELQAYTPTFQQQFRDGRSLDEILPEAYAVAREASTRVMGMRPSRNCRSEEHTSELQSRGHLVCR